MRVGTHSEPNPGERSGREEVAPDPVPGTAAPPETTAPLTVESTLALQRSAGNAAVAHLIESRAAGGGRPEDDGDDGIDTGPRSFVRSSSRPAPLARQPAPAAGSGVKNKEGILDGAHIKTYGDAAEFLTSRAAELEKERGLILGDTAPAPPSLFNAADEARRLAATCRAGGSGPIDEVTYDEVDAWYTKAGKAMAEGEDARIALAAQKLREIKLKAEEGDRVAADTQAKLADKRAAAFAKSDSSILGKIFKLSEALAKAGIAFKLMKERALETERVLETPMATAARVAAAQGGPNVGKISASYKLPQATEMAPVLQAARTVIAAIDVAMAAAELLSPKKSESEKAKSDIKAAVKMTGAVGTLIGAASGVNIMLSFYIGPMTDACLKALGGLEDVGRTVNRDLIAQGLYDKVNWSLEPGGRAVFDFMLAVRNASGPEAVPSPVPKAVADYFVDNKSEIEAGVTGGDEGEAMPTTGHWFWKKTDPKKIAKWVFDHKQYLWEIFYGSKQPNVT